MSSVFRNRMCIVCENDQAIFAKTLLRRMAKDFYISSNKLEEHKMGFGLSVIYLSSTKTRPFKNDVKYFIEKVLPGWKSNFNFSKFYMNFTVCGPLNNSFLPTDSSQEIISKYCSSIFDFSILNGQYVDSENELNFADFLIKKETEFNQLNPMFKFDGIKPDDSNHKKSARSFSIKETTKCVENFYIQAVLESGKKLLLKSKGKK